ncbi:MAG: PHP domain-containing protein [Erysipelotrichaceae bacterium]
MEQIQLKLPQDVALTLQINKNGTSYLFANKILVNEVLSEDITGLDLSVYDNKSVPVTIVNKILCLPEGFKMPLESIFKKGLILNIEKKDSLVEVSLQDMVLSLIPSNEFPSIFSRRTSFKGVIHDDEHVMISRYIETHTHSDGSILDGIIKVPELVKKLEWCGAITDHGNMFEVYNFNKQMQKLGKKPILGCEIYLERPHNTEGISKEEKESISYKRKYNKGEHLILLAKNKEGVKNLNYIVSKAYENFHSKPHVTYESLREHHNGLMATTACIKSTLSMAIREKDEALADCFLNEMIDIFGKEDFYIEIQRHNFELEVNTMNEVLTYARKYGLKIIAGNDAHYLNKEDAYIHEIRLCLKNKTTMDDENRFCFGGSGYYIHNSDEMVQLWSDLPEALDNTLEIADKVEVIQLDSGGKNFLPDFPIQNKFKIYANEEENQKEYFLKLCRDGFKSRFQGTPYGKDNKYLNRMKEEIDTILKMGFPSYFSIVRDFIIYAGDDDVFSHWREYLPESVTDRLLQIPTLTQKEKEIILSIDEITKRDEIVKIISEVKDADVKEFLVAITKDYKILTGPGRGSAAGSLVAYCLGITKINPIPYDLLFERFLNPDRISMPDIDVDIADINREEIINYKRIKYGKESVSRIITFGTSAARAGLKDVVRVFPAKELSHDKNVEVTKTFRVALGNQICKAIPKDPTITLPRALNESIEFKELYESSNEYKKIIDCAIQLEGLKKSISQHPCGIIITNGKVMDYMPQILVMDKELGIKQWTTQYEAPTCEELGCLKMDDLGLRTLGVADITTQTINQRYKEGFYSESTESDAILEFRKKINEKREECEKALLKKVELNQINKSIIPEIKEFLEVDIEKVSMEFILKFALLLEKLNDADVYINKDSLSFLNKDKNLVDFDNIPILDTNVYRFMSKGLLDGIFQVESPYMKSLTMELFQDIKEKENQFNKNTWFLRLADANALARPGPMDEIPAYISSMLHPEDVMYDTPELESILKPTNGVIVFQEQMMRICRELAGFSPGDADSVRKGCAKKKEALINEYGYYFIYGSKQKNIPGCVNRGISEDVATTIWDKLKKFGSYGFNKSHSVPYSYMTAATAWLSYYFPSEYMVSILNSFISNTNKIMGYISICKTRNINILPPDVNQSGEIFQLDGKDIRFGLKGIKELGQGSKFLISERNRHGKFQNIQNLVQRMARYECFTKGMYEALVYSGALDLFEGTRLDKMCNIEIVLAYAKTISLQKRRHQTSIFDLEQGIDTLANCQLLPLQYKNVEMQKQMKLAKEHEYARFYITEHPLDSYRSYLNSQNATPISFLLPEDEAEEFILPSSISKLEEEEDDDFVRKNTTVDFKNLLVAGLIKEFEIKHRSSDGKPFGIFQLEDYSSVIKCVIFSKKYEEFADKLVDGAIVMIKGRLNVDDFGAQIQVNAISDINDMDSRLHIRSIYLIASENEERAKKQFTAIKNIAQVHPGNTRVLFKSKWLGNPGIDSVQIDFDVLDGIQEIMGEQNVTVNHA